MIVHGLIGVRKWALTLVAVLGAYILCATGKMADSVAAQLVGAVILGYFGGNVGAKWTAQRNGGGG